MISIEERALEILEQFPIHKRMPASISGKHHIGETSREHLKLAVNVMKHMCKEFNINSKDRDMLLGATWLHDIGLYVITQEGKVGLPGWKYYEQTNYSRLQGLMAIHPTIGVSLLDDYDIPRKSEIQRLIRVHMSHWYKLEPNPDKLYEYLICVSDYVASFGKGIFNYKERKNEI